MNVPSALLRPAVAADEPHLFHVYAASRTAELALVSWSRDEQIRFLTQQHEAQRASYRQLHAEAEFLVIELPDGRPIGRMYLSRVAVSEIRVLDIALLPEWCGQGVGSALLRVLLAEADAAGDMVSLHVEIWNPAVNLYERLGFVEAGRNDIHIRMEHHPPTS